MRGGARPPHARRTLCTLSVRPRAPTKQMGLFQQPARSRRLRRAVVRELERDPEVFGLQQGDDGLQVVAVLACDADLLLLDRGLHPNLAVLDEPDDLPGLLRGDAVLEADP